MNRIEETVKNIQLIPLDESVEVWVVQDKNGNIMDLGKNHGKFHKASHAKLSLLRYVKRQMLYDIKYTDRRRFANDHAKEVTEKILASGRYKIVRVL